MCIYIYINITIIIFNSNSAETCWDVNWSLTSILYSFKFKTLWKWFGQILYIIKYECLYTALRLIQILRFGHVTTDILVDFYDTWLKLSECGRAETFVLCIFNSGKILLSERRVITIRKKYYSYNVCHLSLPNVNWWYKY